MRWDRWFVGIVVVVRMWMWINAVCCILPVRSVPSRVLVHSIRSSDARPTGYAPLLSIRVSPLANILAVYV